MPRPPALGGGTNGCQAKGPHASDPFPTAETGG
jgi:hypothetical protein